MLIDKLSIESVRNIAKLDMRPHISCNIIVGENGSGKSSILESIHFLGFGRSFRKSKISEVIQFEKKECIIFASVKDKIEQGSLKNFGIKKSKSGDNEIRIAGEKTAKLSQLSAQFPIISFTSDSLDLIEGGPLVRRRFIDWLVFHVKHSENVSQVYKDFYRVLEQRNQALKLGNKQQINAWTQQFVELNLQIQSYRNEMINLLNQYLANSFKEIESTKLNLKASLTYKLGWNENSKLHDLLTANIETEIRRKTSCFGVHRDDVSLELDSVTVKNILSRGECKRFVLAIFVAAERIISELTDKKCIWLLDDIAAELDTASLKRIMAVCDSTDNQMFFTCIEKDLALIKQVSQFGHKVFHVKHGELIKNEGLNND